MSLRISPQDPRLSWPGAISVDHGPGASMPWRLPHQELPLFPPDALREQASMPAGVRLTFRSDTQRVAGFIEAQEIIGNVDICCNGHLCASLPLAGLDHFQWEGFPTGENLIELWLPASGVFRLKELHLSEGASLIPHEDTRPRWVTYGSSITQCRGAESPVFTWPAIVARECGLNLTCLGYAGQCHLDGTIARVIRDLPVDYISLCLGINVYGSASLSERSFRPAIINFIRTIREGHPETPIVAVSPIFSPDREQQENKVGWSLVRMRAEISETVATFRELGDANIHYVSGLEIFGPDLAHQLPDQLHPNPEGYKQLGRNFAEKVPPRYFI